MKKIVTMTWVMVFLMGFLTNGSLAQEVDQGVNELNSICVVPGIDKDKVPFPFRTANTKFDLAEGETYILAGNIVMVNQSPYFNIDFGAQPWLATKKRLQTPLFPIDPEDHSTIRKYGTTSEIVEIAVVMKKMGGQESAVRELGLKVVATPDLLRAKPDQQN